MKLAEKFLKRHRDVSQHDELYKEFELLTLEDIRTLIDFIIEEMDRVSIINKLIRLRNTTKLIFDYKLLFEVLINTLNLINNEAPFVPKEQF